MKPVVICRYAPHEGPGYFATYLSDNGIPWRLLKIDEGEPLPAVSELGGLAMMGGPMSANDDLPWIAPMLDLIRESVDADVPVIGHCLGGQLMAKALGGEVTRNPVKEIGWGQIDVLRSSGAPDWGPAESFVSFHWHGETFSIPRGAVRIWSSAHCENQAFAVGQASRDAMPHRDDRRDDRALVRIGRARDRAQPRPQPRRSDAGRHAREPVVGSKR